MEWERAMISLNSDLLTWSVRLLSSPKLKTHLRHRCVPIGVALDLQYSGHPINTGGVYFKSFLNKT